VYVAAVTEHFPERESRAMKMIVLGIASASVLALGASLILNARQRTAYEGFATESVRVGDPGHNLVGWDWSGNAQPIEH